MEKFHLAIISTQRPHNVEFMQQMCQPFECYWYVNEGEKNNYLSAGAYNVNDWATNICEARNNALCAAAFKELPCIQISDDLRNIKIITPTKKPSFIDFSAAVDILFGAQKQTGLLLGGVANTSNALNYNNVDITVNKLLGFSLFLMMPNDYRFDEKLALKEDYDANIYFILNRGGTFRCDNILCEFPHRQNAGGANTYRNDSTEGIATEKLIAKWPNFVKMNPRRPGQVLLNYPAIREFKNSKQNNLFDL